MVFNWILNKIAGDYNQRQINKILPIVSKINEFDKAWNDLTDAQIQGKTQEFKDRIKGGESLDGILPEAFATVKQACRRLMGKTFEVKGTEYTWDMIPYDVQLIGGIVLHKGNIAEMKTGEGKTLVATLPVYLNALSGKGVHVVTVNDYLASRDAQWMGFLYEWLGLSIGVVIKSVPVSQRRAQYEKDITYVENSELGFDYLRDNLAHSLAERNLIRRKLNFAIIDEVDSILIDEARTPLIISQASAEPTEKYEYYAKIANVLIPSRVKKKTPKGFLKELLSDDIQDDIKDEGDYYIDEKIKNVSLSSQGIKKLEELLKVENLYKDLGYEEIHHIENSLKAKAVYMKDKDYIVKDSEVLIVDEHTGRVMPGRRYSEGLHQAIEAKEGVRIQKESTTLATITYQHFFKLYKKISGMTGTASTEGEEFEQIYDLEVIGIPTNKEVIRVDKNDKVYFNQKAKRKSVVNNIKFYHNIGNPILIGTSSIGTSEYVSSLLKSENITHYVLNAKYHEQEAQIISNAGKKGSVVVATNMAGRGTDIKLEKGLNQLLAKNYADWVKDSLKGSTYTAQEPKGLSLVIYSEKEFEITMEGLKQELNITDQNIRDAENGWVEVKEMDLSMKINFNKNKKIKQDAFVELIIKPLSKPDVQIMEQDIHYGLFILGSEKHDSRRIDNQLRGRAGRQGDPGISQFFVALDDEIMRKMGGERIQAIARMLLPASELEDLELTQKQFTSSIQRSQKQMEGWHFSIRKHLFDYDSVINKQRQRIYQKRDDILFKIQDETVDFDLVGEVKTFIREIIEKLVDIYTLESPWNLAELVESLVQVSGHNFMEKDFVKFKHPYDLKEYLVRKFEGFFDEKIKDLDNEKLFDLITRQYLFIIDKYWIRHIDDLNYLREKVALYGYAQENPLVIYKKEAFDKFQKLLFNIKKEVVAFVLRADLSMISNVQKQEVLEAQISTGEDEKKIVDILKDVSDKDISKIVAQNISVDVNSKPLNKPIDVEVIEIGGGEKAKVLEKSSDIEVLEVSDENTGTTNVNLSDKKKIRPNDPCPCGSGKKYKKCCGKK